MGKPSVAASRRFTLDLSSKDISSSKSRLQKSKPNIYLDGVDVTPLPLVDPSQTSIEDIGFLRHGTTEGVNSYWSERIQFKHDFRAKPTENTGSKIDYILEDQKPFLTETDTIEVFTAISSIYADNDPINNQKDQQKDHGQISKKYVDNTTQTPHQHSQSIGINTVKANTSENGNIPMNSNVPIEDPNSIESIKKLIEKMTLEAIAIDGCLLDINDV